MAEDEEDLAAKVERRRREALPLATQMSILSRTEPEIYEFVKRYAEENNLTINQAVAELLKKQVVIQNVTMKGMTADQLLISFDILKEFMKFGIQSFVEMSKLFFSEMTQSYSQLIQEKVKEIEASKRSPISEKLVDKVVDLMMPMLQYTMASTFKAAKIPLPENLKANIPVELQIENEK
jgi:vacuolar-type H+-ATPase catalytic subunit A/Vma1